MAKLVRSSLVTRFERSLEHPDATLWILGLRIQKVAAVGLQARRTFPHHNNPSSPPSGARPLQGPSLCSDFLACICQSLVTALFFDGWMPVACPCVAPISTNYHFILLPVPPQPAVRA